MSYSVNTARITKCRFNNIRDSIGYYLSPVLERISNQLWAKKCTLISFKPNNSFKPISIKIHKIECPNGIKYSLLSEYDPYRTSTTPQVGMTNEAGPFEIICGYKTKDSNIGESNYQ